MNFIIFGMSSYKSNPAKAIFEIEFYDKAVIIAFNIKNHSILR